MTKHKLPTLWQTPNLPLITWIVATLAGKLVAHGKLHELLLLIAFGAIFTWAWLEIFSGINNFRRALGVIVLVASIYSKLH